MGFRTKIMLAVLPLIGIGLVIINVADYVNSSGRIQDQQAARLRLVRSFFTTQLQTRSQQARSLAFMVAGLEQSGRLMGAKKRDELARRLLPVYRGLKKKFGANIFQFHLPPARSFLRLHMPAKFGDDLSSFRFTVLKVNQEGIPVSGIEIGRGGPSIRGVVPVKRGDRQVGSVEVGFRFIALIKGRESRPVRVHQMNNPALLDLSVTFTTVSGQLGHFHSPPHGNFASIRRPGRHFHLNICTDFFIISRLGQTCKSRSIAVDLPDFEFFVTGPVRSKNNLGCIR